MYGEAELCAVCDCDDIWLLESILLALVAPGWSELVLKDLQENYFATDIDQSAA